MKFIRRILIALTAFLLLGVIGAAIWITLGRDRLHSSPVSVRENVFYEKALAASAGLPPMPEELWADVTIATNAPEMAANQEYLELSFPETSLENRAELPWEIERGDGRAPIQAGEGAIRIENLGVAYSIPKTNFDWSIRVPMQIFNARLEPIPLEEASPRNRWERELSFTGKWPQFRIVCATTNFSHLKVLGWDLFDATTHWSVNSSRSYGLDSLGRIRIEGECETWRPTPLELVLYLAAGPVTETLIEPKAGGEVRGKFGAVKLMAVYDQDMSNWSSSSNGRTNTVRLGAARNSGGYDPGPISTFAFLAWPHANHLPLEIEALDQEGKVIPGHGGGSSDRLVIATARAPLFEVHQIRVRSFEKVYKVVLTIPELPGLPEENRNLENLFDTHIPFLRVRYEHDLQNVVKDLVQMNSHHLSLVYPNGYFPVTYTNTTAREVFEEMASLCPEGQRLAPHPEKNHIEVLEPPLIALWKRVKSLFGFR